jgi:hypothetical protein
MVSDDDGSRWRVLTHVAHPTPGSGFAHYRTNLSRFAGRIIRVRFDFDTFDGEDNEYEGWYLDNIRVSRLGLEPVSLRVSPAALNFSVVPGGLPPTARTITASTEGGNGTERLVWTAAATSGSSWVNLLPASGQTPSAVQVSVAPLGLAPGVYHGEIRFQELNRSATAVSVVVTLTVEAPQRPSATWSFEEEGRGAGISVVDGSGHTDKGATAGAGTDSVPGVVGRARVFDGAGAYLQFPGSPDFAPASLTLRTWVKLNDYPNTLGVIASALGGNVPQGWFVGVLGAGNLALMVRGPDNQSMWLVSRTALTPRQWHAVTVTLDGPQGQAAVYLDGAWDAFATFVAYEDEAARPFTIGRASWWDGYYLAFTIDETRLDSRAWSAAEVRADAAAFSPPVADPPAMPVAEWRLEEMDTAAGATLADFTERGHDALVQGAGARTVPGVHGDALAFGPGTYARVAAHADLATPGFGFSTWIKLDAHPQNWGVIFSTFDGNSSGWFTGVDHDGRIIFSLWGQDSFSSWVASGQRLQPGRWHHLAVSFDDLSRRAVIFVDGKPDRSFLASGFTPPAGSDATFARASWFDGYYLGCTLDEAKLFAVALATYEIQREFTQSSESPLRAAGVSSR